MLEGPIAVAGAAIEAQEWEEARTALAPYLDGRPPARICTLMARIEAGELGDKGREREWLARAVRAPRDRAWIADGYISDRWLPVSPVTGAVDGFEWKAPADAIGRGDDTLLIDEPIVPEPAPSLALPRVSEVVEVRPASEKDIDATAKPAPAPTPPPPAARPKPAIFVPERPRTIRAWRKPSPTSRTARPRWSVCAPRKSANIEAAIWAGALLAPCRYCR